MSGRKKFYSARALLNNPIKALFHLGENIFARNKVDKLKEMQLADVEFFSLQNLSCDVLMLWY